MSKPITKEASRRWRERNPLYFRVHNFKIAHGLTFDFIRDLYQRQKGCCAFCGEPLPAFDDTTKNAKTMTLDHNHKTNEVRGLVHRSCNLIVGYLELLMIPFERAQMYMVSSVGVKITGKRATLNV